MVNISFRRARQAGIGILLGMVFLCAGAGILALHKTKAGLDVSNALFQKRAHYGQLALHFTQLRYELLQDETDPQTLLEHCIELCDKIRSDITAIDEIPESGLEEAHYLESIATHEKQLRTIIYVYAESLDYRHTDNGREMRTRMQRIAEESTLEASDHATELNQAMEERHLRERRTTQLAIWVFTGIAAVAMAVGVAISLTLTHILVAHLQSILKGTEEFARGNLRYEIPVTHHDEFGQLAGSINTMVDQLKQRTNELQQSQKIEAIGRLAGGVAHDFNNLLTIILGYCGILLEGMDADSEEGQLIQEVDQAGERAAVLTRQLLAFSRKQVLQPQLLSMNDVVQNMDKMLHRLVGDEVEYTTVFGADPDRVRADPGQIEQVIMNLVVNARDAMPEGGKVVVETSTVVVEEAYSEFRERLGPGEYVMLAVSDNGHGMDESITDNIFEPFFTTKEKGRGTGLGLSTVHGIIKQSGGLIEVHSAKGLGTTFKIYLPLASEPGDTLHAPAKKRTGSYKKTRQGGILLAEDEASVRKLISTLR